jgi:hypothetical protein
MKATEFLSEDSKVWARKHARAIGTNCVPFLQAINYRVNQTILYRGLAHDSTNMKILQCPHNRKPRNTSIVFHNMLEKYFKDRFGIPYRSSSIFATGSKDNAMAYTNHFSVAGLHAMFPIGSPKFCWSPNIDDLTVHFEIYDDKAVLHEGNIIKELDRCQYREGDMKSAIASGCEIMIHGDCYALDMGSSNINLSQLELELTT